MQFLKVGSKRTQFPVRLDMHGIDAHKKHPEHEADEPRVPRGPELEHQLCGGEV